jgi:hypothetical protein
VSPSEWISPQVGFYSLKGDGSRALLNVSVPIEFRTETQSMYLHFDPEVTIDGATGKKAEGFGLQSRFGKKFSLIANGLMADSGFSTTNSLNQGYGDLRHNFNFKAEYDITKELPVTYSQQDISEQNGTEQHNALTAGAHFLGIPFCDVTLSRNVVDGRSLVTATRDTVTQSGALVTVPIQVQRIVTVNGQPDTVYTDSLTTDTLNRIKNKLQVNLYETSSPILEGLLHCNRITYNVSWTIFSSQIEHADGMESGNILYGNFAVSPTKRITISGNGTFLNNPAGSLFGRDYSPTLIVQTIDAPPGIDFSASDYMHYQSLSDSSISQIIRSASLIMKPGTWMKFFNWISLIAGVNQTLNCAFDQASPGASDLMFGKDPIRNSITRDIGANLFVTDDVTLRNDNQFTGADSSTTYYSFNDLKWWFNSKQLWQTRWEYTYQRPRFGGLTANPALTKDWQRGFSRYTNSWTSWLQTMAGIHASYLASGIASEYDTTYTGTFPNFQQNIDTIPRNGSNLKVGPDITVNIVTQRLGCFRSIFSNQTLTVSKVKTDGIWQAWPEIAYVMNLKAVILPNISLTLTNSFLFGNGTFRRYNGDIIATLIF